MMDWYFALWVFGAFITWGALVSDRVRRLNVMPELYYTLVLLWPLVWVLAGAAGLIGVSMRILGWCAGIYPRNQG
jgi:hypothetical protein